MDTERIRRITAMEQRLDHIAEALAGIEKALHGYADLAGDLKALTEYYESGEWLTDFEADERGELPKDLKRGVLSEDAVYNLLSDVVRIKECMRELTE